MVNYTFLIKIIIKWIINYNYKIIIELTQAEGSSLSAYCFFLYNGFPYLFWK